MKKQDSGTRRRRLGGKGLSLEAFAAAKGRSSHNPSEIKKQREHYQNASKVRKYKRLKKQLDAKDEIPHLDSQAEAEAERKPVLAINAKAINANESLKASNLKDRKKTGLGHNSRIREEYETKQREIAEAKERREVEFAEKQEARKRAEQSRKQTKAKMLKKTSRGQPVMKHRLEHLLNSIESSR